MTPSTTEITTFNQRGRRLKRQRIMLLLILPKLIPTGIRTGKYPKCAASQYHHSEGKRWSTLENTMKKTAKNSRERRASRCRWTNMQHSSICYRVLKLYSGGMGNQFRVQTMTTPMANSMEATLRIRADLVVTLMTLLLRRRMRPRAMKRRKRRNKLWAIECKELLCLFFGQQALWCEYHNT